MNKTVAAVALVTAPFALLAGCGGSTSAKAPAGAVPSVSATVAPPTTNGAITPPPNASSSASGTAVGVRPSPSAPTYDPMPYPPRSYVDLTELAGQTADSPQALGTENVSYEGCAKQTVSILIPPGTDPRTVIGLLAEKTMMGTGDVFGYGSRADYDAGAGYTAGRLIHNDPCKPDDTITVNVGGIAVNDEYTFPAH